MKNIYRWLIASTVSILVGIALVWFGSDVGLNNISFAFWINWFLMFWAYLMHRSGVRKFPNSYFKEHAFEKRSYDLLGVKFYQRFIRKVSIFNPELKLDQGKKGLQNLEQATRNAETARLMIFIIVSGFMVNALIQRWWLAAFWYLLFNCIINGYPVMVQRYNRMRIGRLLELLRR